MNTGIKITIGLVICFVMVACQIMGESSTKNGQASLIGRWSLEQAGIEGKEVKWRCEGLIPTIESIKYDTLILNGDNDKFRSNIWEIKITGDSVTSPNEIEDRIQFGWAFSPERFIENNLLSETNKYRVAGDTLYLKNRITALYAHVQYYFTYYLSVDHYTLVVKPGVILDDTTKIPSPKPVYYPCASPDSVDRTARLFSATLKRK
jgi:hypothetical protein